MSKGPGKWQRLILHALHSRNWVIVCDLLPEDAKRAEQSALNRAAHALGKLGNVDITYHSRLVHSPNWWNKNRHVEPRVLVVTKPGFDAPIQFRGQWMPRARASEISSREFEEHYGMNFKEFGERVIRPLMGKRV